MNGYKVSLHEQLITIEMEGINNVLDEADRLRRNGLLNPEQNRYATDLERRLRNLELEQKRIFDVKNRYKLFE